MRILGCALLSAGLTTGFIQTRLPLIRHNKKSSSCHTSFTPPLSSSRSRLAYSANDYLDNLPKFVSDEKPLGSFATDTYLNTLSQFTDPASASVAIYKPEEYLQNLCSTFIENNNGVVSSVSERIGELSKLSAQENSISILSGLASDSPSIQSPDFSNLKQDLSESLESIKSEIPIFTNQGSSGNDQDSAPNTINDSQSTTDSMNTVIASNSDEQISTSSNPTDTFEAASISDYTDNIDTSLASTSSIDSTTVSDNQPYLSENSVSDTESIPSNDVSESVSIANDGESTFVSNSIDDSIIDSSVGFDQSLPVEPSVPESMPETTINSVLTSDTLEQSNINNNENVDVSEFAGLPEEKPTLFDTTDPETKTFFNDMFEGDASSPETIIASDNAQVIDQSVSSTDVGNSLASTNNDVPDFSNTVSEQPSLAYIVDSTENVLSSSNNNNFDGIGDNNDFTDSFSAQNSIGASEYIPENSFEQSTFETDVLKDTTAFASNNAETEQAQTSFENNFDTPEPVNTFSEASETTTDTLYSTNTEGFDDSTAFASNNIEMQPSTYEETNDFSNNFGISESESVQDSVYSAENNLGQPTFEESTTFASDDMQMEQVQATYENNEDFSNSFDSPELESTQNSMETVYDSSYNTDGFVENTAFETENVEMDQGIIDGTNNDDFSNSYSVPESETVQNSMDAVYTSSENRFEQNAPGESTTFASENIEMEQVQATYENDDYFSNSLDSSDLGNTQNSIKSEIVQDSMESAYTSKNVEMNQEASFESGNDLSNNNGFDSPTVDNSQVSTSTGFESATVSSTDDSRFEDTSAFATNNLDMGESNYEETNTFTNSFSVSEPEETMRDSLDTSFTSDNSYEQVDVEQVSYENSNDISNSFYSSDMDTSQASTSTLYESTSTPSSDAFEGEASFGSNNIEVEQASYGETDTFSNSFSSQEYDNNVQNSMDTVYATENRNEQSTTEPDTVFQSSVNEIEQGNYESSADFSNGFSTSGGENTQDNTNTVYESASTSASSIDGSSDSTSFTSNDIDTYSLNVPESENVDSTYSSVSASTSSPEVFTDTTSFASEPIDLEQYSPPSDVTETVNSFSAVNNEPLADLTDYSSESNNNMVTDSVEGFAQSESYSVDTTITSNSLQSNEASTMNMNDPIASVAEPPYLEDSISTTTNSIPTDTIETSPSELVDTAITSNNYVGQSDAAVDFIPPSSSALEQSSIADIITNSPSNSDVIETTESISAPLDLTSQLSELSNSYDKMMSNDQFAPRGNMAFLPPTEKIEQIKSPELPNLASGISEKIAKAFQSGSINFMEANNNYNNRGFAGLVESGQASISNSVNQISESSLSDLANGFLFGLEAMGMALYDIIDKFLDDFAGTSFAIVLENAQVSLENILNGAYGVVDDAFQSFYSLGDVTLKEVAIAVVTIISTVAKLLFSMLSAVVQVVSGQSIQEWAVAASNAVEYEANEVVSIANAALNDLSHQTLSELGNMVGHFSYDVANLMVESVNTASGMVS